MREPAKKSMDKATIVFSIMGFLLFAPIGALILYKVYLNEAYAAWQARNWPSVPCTVVSSDVEYPDEIVHRYRVKLTYRYTVNGTERTGSRLDFSRGAWEDPYIPGDILRTYKPGLRKSWC